jgi:hypothetical protein
MIALGASQAIDGGSTNAATVNCTITGCLTDTSVPPVAQSFKVLYQGQLGAAVASLFACSASQNALISSINLFNTGAQQTVTIAINGTASTQQHRHDRDPRERVGHLRRRARLDRLLLRRAHRHRHHAPRRRARHPRHRGHRAHRGDRGPPGRHPVPAPTGSLVVGQRFRWTINLIKTAAGTATFAVKVKYGTNGTTADAAIASWTSGTNTAAIDQASLVIETTITALGSGSSATASSIAYYSNTLTDVTGLGRINHVPGSTAGFDSTAATPFFHVDITAGASAVMTGVGMAEQIR